MALLRKLKGKSVFALVLSILLYLQYRQIFMKGTDSQPQVRYRKAEFIDTVSIVFKPQTSNTGTNVKSTTAKAASTAAATKAQTLTAAATTKTVTLKPKELPYHLFRYPLEVDMANLVQTIKNQGQVEVKPIFTYPYHNVLAPTCKCGCLDKKDPIAHNNLTQPYLLLLIKSAPVNFIQRETIRETWGNENLLPDFRTKRVFLIGRSEEKEVQKKTLNEANTYNDILLLSYVDNYYYNTFKTIGGLNWAVKYCSNTKYVLFIDDDFYMNPVLLFKYMDTISPEQNRHLFMGRMWDDIPQRGPQQKWYMPISVYPFKKYPPFLSAGFMLLSMEFARDVQIAIQYTKKFKFDDVFLAIVVKKLGVTPQHNDKVIIVKDANITANSVKDIIAHHRFGNTTLLKEAWAKFKKHFMSSS